MLTCHKSRNQEIFMFSEIQCWETAKMNEEEGNGHHSQKAKQWKRKKRMKKTETETPVGSYCHVEAKQYKK